MKVLELKGSIVEMVARVQDEQSLEHIQAFLNDFLEQYDREQDEIPLSELSPDQEAELAVAIEESYHPENWVSHEDVMKRVDTWLKR
jgi:hypothetical protein